MNTSPSAHRFLAACALGLCLMGCRVVKPPAGITPRSYVLTRLPARSAPAQEASTNIVVGIRPIKVPGYLSSKSFAMRQGSNQIVYLESAKWAERLDAALQSVLAANLSTLIPTDQVRFSQWTPGTVAVQVDVNVEQFDVDSRGEGVLIAWWRILSPGGQKIIASGKFSATRSGPPPNADAGGAAATMSNLVADLAEKLAQAIKGRAGSD